MTPHLLAFSIAHQYSRLARQQRGVFLEVAVAAGAVIAPHTRVYVDCASTYSVFGRQWAERLHLDWDSGEPLRISTAAGVFHARLHEVTLSLSLIDLEWTAWVAFAEWDSTPPSPARDVLGLNGFFDRFLVAIDDLEESIYLEPHFLSE